MSLNGQISKTDSQIVVTYRLHNTATVPIFVWDIMVKTDPNGQLVDPDLAYVCWEEPETLRITRAMLPLPLDFSIAVKEVPYVRKLDPKDTVDGRIILPIPVREYSPFYSPADSVRSVACTKVRLIIGWSEQKAGMAISTREVGGQKVMAIRGGWALPLQRWEETSLNCDLLIEVRTDRFDRRPPMQ